MTSEEIKRLRKRIGLRTQAMAAEALGLNSQQAYAYHENNPSRMFVLAMKQLEFEMTATVETIEELFTKHHNTHVEGFAEWAEEDAEGIALQLEREDYAQIIADLADSVTEWVRANDEPVPAGVEDAARGYVVLHKRELLAALRD